MPECGSDRPRVTRWGSNNSADIHQHALHARSQHHPPQRTSVTGADKECRECIMSERQEMKAHKYHFTGAQETHRSGARVGHPVLIGRPVVLRPLPVRKRTIESRPDVVHVVHAHGVAFEHGAAKTGFCKLQDELMKFGMVKPVWFGKIMTSPSTYLVVLKRPKISGFFPSLLVSTKTSSETRNVEFIHFDYTHYYHFLCVLGFFWNSTLYRTMKLAW